MAAAVYQGFYSPPPMDRIRYGTGLLKALPAELDRLGVRRPMVVTGPTVAGKTPLLRALLAGLPEGAPVYEECQAHVPVQTVLAGAALARLKRADCLISLGGGSPIDTAKAIALALARGASTPADLEPAYVRFALPDRVTVPPGLNGAPIPHIAIPTTASAAEFTGLIGITDPAAGRKNLVNDPGLTPAVALLDPELTLHTPDWLWCSTAIRSLDHAVEAACGKRATPYTDALAHRAVQLLFRHLPACHRDQRDLEARAGVQFAAWLSIWALLAAGSGLSHGLGYVLGGSYGVPHGISSCVCLPAVMAWNLPATAEKQAEIAAATGRGHDGAAAHVAVRELITALELPVSLRQTGRINRSDLSAIAEAALSLPNAAANPRAVRTAADVTEILELAW